MAAAEKHNLQFDRMGDGYIAGWGSVTGLLIAGSSVCLTITVIRSTGC